MKVAPYHRVVVMVAGSGAAMMASSIPGQDKKILNPVQDRIEIVKIHAKSSLAFAQSEVDAVMLGGYSAYHYWYDNGKKGPNPFYSIPVETVVAAIKALTLDEVRNLIKELHVMSDGLYACPKEFVAARDEARRRLAEISP